MFVIPTIIEIGAWFMPEVQLDALRRSMCHNSSNLSRPQSPRWLLIKDREGDALRSLQRLRRGRFTDEEIAVEFRDLKSTLNVASEKGKFKEILRGVNLKRTLITIGANVLYQLTGQIFINTYGTLFVSSLGTFNAFSLTSINAGVNIVITCTVMFLCDRIGRV